MEVGHFNIILSYKKVARLKILQLSGNRDSSFKKWERHRLHNVFKNIHCKSQLNLSIRFQDMMSTDFEHQAYFPRICVAIYFH